MKVKLWQAEERVDQLIAAFDSAKFEFESGQSNLENEIHDLKATVEREKERNGDLQRSNDEKDVMLARLGIVNHFIRLVYKF